MSQNKEWISPISAAQRLGCTVEEVEQLIKGKKLESKTEYGRTQVSKQSVYDLSGLKNDGRQTAKKRGPKCRRMSFTQAAAELGTDEAHIQALVDAGKLEYAVLDDAGCGVSTKSVKAAKGGEKAKDDEEGFVPYGIKEEFNGTEEKQADQTEEAAKEKGSATHEREILLTIAGGEGAFSEDDIKEAVDIAYRLGKLDVYESLDSFERRLV